MLVLDAVAHPDLFLSGHGFITGHPLHQMVEIEQRCAIIANAKIVIFWPL